MHYSNSEANAAAERELDRDLDHYFESGEEQLKTFVVTVDITLRAFSKADAKELALKVVKGGDDVFRVEFIECLSEDEV